MSASELDNSPLIAFGQGILNGLTSQSFHLVHAQPTQDPLPSNLVTCQHAWSLLNPLAETRSGPQVSTVEAEAMGGLVAVFALKARPDQTILCLQPWGLTIAQPVIEEVMALLSSPQTSTSGDFTPTEMTA